MKTSHIVGIVVALIALPVACTYIATGQKAATAPARVVSKTLDTDNIIQSYNRFFAINSEYTSRVAQIAAHTATVSETTDAAELGRLRMEVSAMRQSCRTLANDYNADAQKMNTSFFRDKDLPATLDAQKCEA